MRLHLNRLRVIQPTKHITRTPAPLYTGKEGISNYHYLIFFITAHYNIDNSKKTNYS